MQDTSLLLSGRFLLAKKSQNNKFSPRISWVMYILKHIVCRIIMCINIVAEMENVPFTKLATVVLEWCYNDEKYYIYSIKIDRTFQNISKIMLKTITYKIFFTKNHYTYVKYNDFRYNCILASLHLSSTSFTDLSIWKTKSSKWEIVLFTHNLSPIIALLHQFDLELQGKKKVCKNRANGKKLFAFFYNKN